MKHGNLELRGFVSYDKCNIYEYDFKCFEDKLSALIVLTSFVPMLTGTSGNSGGQASAVIIRALSLKEIDLKIFLKLYGRNSE